ncbi:MAG: hypothetical protein ACI4ET_13730 [Bilifractor sp.]
MDVPNPSESDKKIIFNSSREERKGIKMKTIHETIQGLLIDIKNRKAGKFTSSDGREIEYPDADIILILPYPKTDGKVERLKISPSNVSKVLSKLDDVNWGSLITLTLSNNLVIDVNIDLDWIALHETVDI